MWIPAAGLTLASCVLAAETGEGPITLVAFAVLLTATTASAAVGVTSDAGRAQDRVHAALAYARYLVTAALIPLALWAVGAFSRLGIS